MKILNLKIQGYRSLKNVFWLPGNLNFLIGPQWFRQVKYPARTGNDLHLGQGATWEVYPKSWRHESSCMGRNGRRHQIRCRDLSGCIDLGRATPTG